MTYRELLCELSRLTDDQLNCDVTIEVGLIDEYFPAELKICGQDCDVLDEDHPVIRAKE